MGGELMFAGTSAKKISEMVGDRAGRVGDLLHDAIHSIISQTIFRGDPWEEYTDEAAGWHEEAVSVAMSIAEVGCAKGLVSAGVDPSSKYILEGSPAYYAMIGSALTEILPLLHNGPLTGHGISTEPKACYDYLAQQATEHYGIRL